MRNLVLFSLLFAGSASPQSQPQMMQELINAAPPQPGKVVEVPTPLPDAVRQQMLAARTVTPEGILVIKVSDDYLKLLLTAKRLATSTAPTNITLKPAFPQMQFLGYVPEGPNLRRATRLWVDSRGALVMLTEWDWKADGAGFTRFNDPAMPQADIALMRAPQSDAAVWQADWMTDTTQYEFYVYEPHLADADALTHREIARSYARSLQSR